MKRKSSPFVWTIIFLVLLSGFIAREASAEKVAVLKSADIAAYNQALAGFAKEIGSIGTDTYNIEDSPTGGKDIIDKIKQTKPSAILAVGKKATEIANTEIPDIPIVFCMVIEPEKLGLKGNNIAGVGMEVSPEKQISNFKSALPSLKSIGVVYNPENSSQRVKEGRGACQRLGIKFAEITVSAPKEVPDAFRGLVGLVDAIWLLPDTTVLTKASFSFILKTAMEEKIPLLGFSESLVKGGALMSFAVDYRSVGELAGSLVKKILAGTAPGTLALASPGGEFAVNLNIADFLGIKIAEEIKRKAKVID
ncbi:MAG: ABC transporter substrate-binding protein [Deltaproteobacteria bacterium]|nr:MAG: ABC transporter substrate-binding protein [Deltaproteobacteria bacterium]